jgi:Fur family transcriptional regulator, ferric uptake regulator
MERQTRQRQAIYDALVVARRPLLALEVLQAALATVPGLSVATVFRNLKTLVEEGYIETATLPGDNPGYELAKQDHHHHFQCKQCERVFDVHACPGTLKNLAPEGFTVEDHELVLYGHCNECNQFISMVKSTKRKQVKT